MTTQLTIDFRAVSHMKFFYKNQFGLVARVKPKGPTKCGVKIPNEKCFGSDETLLERATRMLWLDVWTPHCVLQLRNNHALKFSGEKAKQMRDSYNRHIYEKSN